MNTQQIDRQIDQALLAAAMLTGFIYARRRARRFIYKAKIGAAVSAGAGALAVAGAVAVAAALRRNRNRTSEAPPA